MSTVGLKYDYLGDIGGNTVHISEAEKNTTYYRYGDLNVEYIVREGDVNRKHFALKNSMSVLVNTGTSSGESPEHYNAKMKIAHEKKYYDTILKQYITFHKVLAEVPQGGKIPDISCYDGNNNLIMAIEIYNTNRKTEDDIEQLRNLNVPLVEIDINNENKCRHLILPTLLESNRRKSRELNKEISRAIVKSHRLEDEIQELQSELEEEVRKSGNIPRKHFAELDRRKRNLIEEIESKATKRAESISEWLQRRLQRTRVKVEELEWHDGRCRGLISEIEQLEGKINDSEKKLQKSGIGTREFKQVEKSIKETQGAIAWNKNRSRQAGTICKRGF